MRSKTKQNKKEIKMDTLKTSIVFGVGLALGMTAVELSIRVVLMLIGMALQ